MPSEFLRLFFWKISVFKKLILLTVTSLFLILPIKTAHSQVIIKERVSINSGINITDIPNGILGDSHNPMYLEQGGILILKLVKPDYMNTNFRDRILYEEELGEIARNQSVDDTVRIGPFPQWKKLQFFLKDSVFSAHPLITYNHYPEGESSIILRNDITTSGYDNKMEFYLYREEYDPQGPEFKWFIKLNVDESLASMPPPEILSFLGNPYIPSSGIEIPSDGEVYLTIDAVRSTVPVELYNELPAEQLLTEDIRDHDGDLFDLGLKNKGDIVRFFIKSSHSVVNGMHLYPKYMDPEPYLDYWGESITFQEFRFEDCTDLDFNDMSCSIYIIPDHFGDIAWPMQVQFNPSVIMPGDTADIILKRRNDDGTFSDFPDTTEFDVEIFKNWEFGNIYSPQAGYNDSYFWGIPQGFKFIANDSINTDSTYVPILINTSSGGIIASSARNNGEPIIGANTNISNATNPSKSREQRLRKIISDLNNRKLNNKIHKTSENKINIPVIPTSIQDFADPDDYSYGMGEVLIIDMDHFSVKAKPDTLNPGKSAKLTVIAKNKANQELSLNKSTLLSLSADSTKYGHFILASGDTVDSPVNSIRYGDLRQGKIKYYVNKDLKFTSDSMKVNITVQKMNDSRKKGTGNIKLDEDLIKILLGETKYFQVKMEDDSLKIEEVKEPKLDGGIADNSVWGNNPVTIDSSSNKKIPNGKRIGVYWETEKPLDNGSNEPTGIIRLVGRYWSKDSTYKFILTAKHNGKISTKKFKIQNPSKLGDKFYLSKDVFDKEFNVDSLIVKYCGQSGIPPQLIKGQMATESPKTYFGGKIDSGFAPGYRYEPYTTEFKIRKSENDTIWPNSPFKVTKTSMGTGEAVPDHKNVKIISYPAEHTTIWDMVKKYSDLDGKCTLTTQRMYGKIDDKDNNKFNFTFYGYRKIQRKCYDPILKFFQKNKENPSPEDINSANDSIAVYLRDKWNGGLKNILAQTRIASSYGLLQILYTTAINKGYNLDSNHRPEALNENPIFFPLALSYHSNNLINLLGKSVEKRNNWILGFDEAFKRMMELYNDNPDYVNKVIANTKYYLPTK